MVDTISNADAYRMGKVIDHYTDREGQQRVTEQEEIEEALEDRMDGWSQSQIDGFAKKIADRRSTDTSDVTPDDRETIENRTTVSGGGVTGNDNRVVMQKDANGKFLGKSDSIKTWVDTHGNVMGHNTNTGTRAKLVDSANR